MVGQHERGPRRVAGRVGVQVDADVVGPRLRQQRREIGQAARKQLEVFLNHKVFLGLEVIVIPGWREDEEALRELGYE